MSDDLNDLIRSWTVDADAPAGLHARVWRDIHVRSRRHHGLLAGLERWSVEPRMIAASVAFALLLGVAAAELRVREQEALREREMAERYLSMLEIGVR